MYTIHKRIDPITKRNIAYVSTNGQVVAEAVEYWPDGVVSAVRMSTGKWTRNEYERVSLAKWCERFEAVAV